MEFRNMFQKMDFSTLYHLEQQFHSHLHHFQHFDKGHSMPTWPNLENFLLAPSQNLMRFSPFVCIVEKWKSWTFQLFWPKCFWDMVFKSFKLFWLGVNFELPAIFLRAYNSVCNKGLNLKSSVPNNPLKTCRKQKSICGNQVFTWLLY